MDSPMPVRHWMENLLRERIAQGFWKPGSRISESALAQELGISRGPIRESLRRLEAEGILEYLPRRGCVVRSHSTEELRELATLRIILEKFACQLALQNDVEQLIVSLEHIYQTMLIAVEEKEDWSASVHQDMSFHRTILDHSGHSLLKQHWNLIAQPTFFFINIQPQNYEDLMWLTNSHIPILDALKSRSVTAVGEAIETHILDALNLIESRQ
jgi:DNA-binding GntR family transcriptional regulator